MGAPSMHLVIFGTGLLAVLALGLHLSHSLPKYTTLMQEFKEHYATTESEKKIDTSCWLPAQTHESAVQYAETLCATNFENFLYGRTSAEDSGISPMVNPVWSNSSQAQDPPFGTAIKLIRSRAAGPQVTGDDVRAGALFTTRLLNLVYALGGMVIGGFVIAVCFSRLAHAHTCFLEAAWQSTAAAPYVTPGGDGDEEKGALLGRPSAAVARRLAILAGSRKLAVLYCLFLLSMLAAFLLTGVMIMNGNKEIDSKINGMLDTRAGVIDKVQEIMAMRAKAAQGGGAAGDQARSQPARGRPQKPTGPPNPVDQIVMDMLTPKVTHDSGIFMCSFEIRQMGNVSPQSIQCSYRVSKTPDKPPYDSLNVLLEIKTTVDAGCWATFLMAALLLVHIVNFYLCSPRSYQKSLLLLTKQLGVKMPSNGLGFAFTDLAFVSAFVPLGGRAVYPVRSSPTVDMQGQSRL